MSVKRLTRLFLVRWAKWTRLLLLGLALAGLAACAPPPPSPPAPSPPPSRVITEGGVEFFVYDLKFPGTNQDFLVRQGGAKTWLPLVMVSTVQFSGPEQEGYRNATIILASGERTEGEIFVDRLINGVTDLGYWNIPLGQVYLLNRPAP